MLLNVTFKGPEIGERTIVMEAPSLAHFQAMATKYLPGVDVEAREFVAYPFGHGLAQIYFSQVPIEQLDAAHFPTEAVYAEEVAMTSASSPQTCPDCGEVFTPSSRYPDCRNCNCPECGNPCEGRNRHGTYCIPCSRAAADFEEMAYGRDD